MYIVHGRKKGGGAATERKERMGHVHCTWKIEEAMYIVYGR